MNENFYGISDKGRLRDNNEDTFVAETYVDQLVLGAVIDGVGGYSGGEVAAEIARDTLLNTFDSPVKGNLEKLTFAIEKANQKIHAERSQNKDHDKMACVLTAAIADINNNKFYYAHVGDTRLYLLRDGSLIKVSRDHSVVGFLEETGRLTEDEAMRHPKRNEINRALGFDNADVEATKLIDTGESPFLPGDLLLLCSDGLSDMITSQTITSILIEKGTIQQRAQKLIDAANEAGGKDNVTVVLVQNNKTPSEHVAIRPPTGKTNFPEFENVNPVIAENILDDRTQHQVNPSFKLFFPFVIILIIIILLFSMFYLNRNKHNPQKLNVTKPINIAELQLRDSILSGKDNIQISTFGNQSIYITKSISIQKDSAHVVGNGITLICDTLNKGACFIMEENCKYLFLDSITLKNFNIGVLVKQKGLHLRNVQFDNCKIPIQYQYLNAQDSSSITKGYQIK